jgi:hypothetical protein
LLRPDPWPSVLIALDLLAWGHVLGLALLAAAPVFTGGRLRSVLRVALTVGGLLSLGGTPGPALGDLRFWWLAAADYAVVLPVIGFLLALHFRAPSPDAATARFDAERLGSCPGLEPLS